MNNKEKVKDFFAFSRREQSGLIVLFGIIVLLIAYYGAKRYFFEPQVYDFASFKDEIDQFYAQDKADSITRITSNTTKEKYNSQKGKSNSSKRKFAGFLFNPNSISQHQWEKLGLSTKQAASIIKYRNKGGKFRIKSDLKKMYTISDRKYQELYPWIDLPEKKVKEVVALVKGKDGFQDQNFDQIDTLSSVEVPNWENTPNTIALKSINLNTADTTDLKAIRGIGSFYARKIVEYREQLGGYISFNQLNEIWKMREETMQAMEPYVFIVKSDVRKIAINEVDVETLKNHPYVSWKIAKALVNYRTQHGKYQSKEDLLKILILPEKDFLNLKPYITIK